MPATLSQVFTSVFQSNRRVSFGTPLINVVSASLNDFFSSYGQTQKKKRLMAWFKNIPELTALASKVARDVASKWHFEPVKPNESGRNKILKANDFSQIVNIRRTRMQQVLDAIVTGEGYGWMGFLKDEMMIDVISKHVAHSRFLEKKEKVDLVKSMFWELKQTDRLSTAAVDEDVRAPRMYRNVASTTVENIFDQVNVKGYRQRVGVNEILFNTEEMIHFTLMDVDGKVNGFTPVESILTQLELLRAMWQNMVSLQKNGGSPDKVFAFENLNPNSAAYKRIEEQLKKYKLVENKHGNMMFTGKLSIHDLQQLDQMQFKDMGLYITGLIAMQWEIPKSSIPYILGGTNTKDDTGGNSEKGYWRNVQTMQKTWADIENTQIWMPHFGVRIVFDNPFIQQDVQKETALSLKLANVQSMNSILGEVGLTLEKNKRLELLNINLEDTEKKDFTIGVPQINNMNNQLSDAEVNDSDDKKNIKKNKRQEQLNLMSRGSASTTGVGKELPFDTKAQIEYKKIQGKESLTVPMDNFINLYNEDKAYHPGMAPRLFMRSNPDFTSFIYKSSDFVYKVVIPSFEVDAQRIKIMNLGGNVHDISNDQRTVIPESVD